MAWPWPSCNDRLPSPKLPLPLPDVLTPVDDPQAELDCTAFLTNGSAQNKKYPSCVLCRKGTVSPKEESRIQEKERVADTPRPRDCNRVHGPSAWEIDSAGCRCARLCGTLPTPRRSPLGSVPVDSRTTQPRKLIGFHP